MPSGMGEEKPWDYEVETEEIKKVADYTGLNFAEVTELDCYTFRLLFRDAYITELKKTEQGREYLEDCYLLTQTEPDRKGLRERFGGVENGGN